MRLMTAHMHIYCNNYFFSFFFSTPARTYCTTIQQWEISRRENRKEKQESRDLCVYGRIINSLS